MFDIVTVGHFSIDYIKLPERRGVKPSLGGSPTYVSLAAKKMGAKVSVISKVGEDFASRYTRWLKNQGVDLSGLKKVDGALTTSYILSYRRDGKRQLILKSRGPLIESQDVPDFIEAKAVHIGPIANEISHDALHKLRGLTSLVSLDPQGFLRRFKEDGKMFLEKLRNLEIVEGVDVFKASREEAEAVTGETNLAQAIRRIYEYGVKNVIVTRGAEGSLVYVKGRLYQVPASKPRVVVDPTGSGDVFIGAFLAEYIREKDPLWCASVGSASASFAVEKLGPRGFGSKKEVYERAAQVYEEISIVRQD